MIEKRGFGLGLGRVIYSNNTRSPLNDLRASSLHLPPNALRPHRRLRRVRVGKLGRSMVPGSLPSCANADALSPRSAERGVRSPRHRRRTNIRAARPPLSQISIPRLPMVRNDVRRTSVTVPRRGLRHCLTPSTGKGTEQ